MKNLFSIGLALLGLTLATSCDKPAPEPGGSPDAGLIITASNQYILADGKAETSFTVRMNGEDVTSKSSIMNYKTSGSVTLPSASFKTDAVGEYFFYAIYEGAFSEKIQVVGVSSFPEMPADPMPSKYDAFKKRVLAMQFTGTWCGWCPRLMKAMHDFNETDAKATDVVFVSAHVGDEMTSVKSSSLDKEFNTTGGWPAIVFSMSADKANQSDDLSKPSQIRDLADKFLKSPALMGLSITSEVIGDKICLRAGVKVSVQGNFMIGAVLLEDGQYAKQTNSTGKSEEYFNTHNNIVRTGYPVTGNPVKSYEALGGKSSVKGGEKYDFYCEFGTKTSDIIDITKTRVVVYVYNMSTKECDNVIVAKVGEKIPFEYL